MAYQIITDSSWDQICAAVGVHTGPYPLGFGVVERWDRVTEA